MEYALQLYNPGRTQLKSGDGTTTYTVATASNTLDTNTWYHIVCQMDTTNSKVYLRINSSLNLTNTATYSQDGTSTFYVGKLQTGGAFNGLIDEVGIWKRLLTTSEISELYNSGTGKTYPFTP